MREALSTALERLSAARDLTFTGGSSGLAAAVSRSQDLQEASRMLREAGRQLSASPRGEPGLGTLLQQHAQTTARLAGLLPTFAVRPELGEASAATRLVETAIGDVQRAHEVLSVPPPA